MSLEKACMPTAPLLNHFESTELRIELAMFSCYSATDWELGNGQQPKC